MQLYTIKAGKTMKTIKLILLPLFSFPFCAAEKYYFVLKTHPYYLNRADNKPINYFTLLGYNTTPSYPHKTFNICASEDGLYSSIDVEESIAKICFVNESNPQGISQLKDNGIPFNCYVYEMNNKAYLKWDDTNLSWCQNIEEATQFRHSGKKKTYLRLADDLPKYISTKSSGITPTRDININQNVNLGIVFECIGGSTTTTAEDFQYFQFIDSETTLSTIASNEGTVAIVYDPSTTKDDIREGTVASESQQKSNRSAVDITINANNTFIDNNGIYGKFKFTENEENPGYYNFQDLITEKYIRFSGGSGTSNALQSIDDPNNAKALWTITIDGEGNTTVIGKEEGKNNLMYNSEPSAHIFSCYDHYSQGKPVCLYQLIDGNGEVKIYHANVPKGEGQGSEEGGSSASESSESEESSISSSSENNNKETKNNDKESITIGIVAGSILGAAAIAIPVTVVLTISHKKKIAKLKKNSEGDSNKEE